MTITFVTVHADSIAKLQLPEEDVTLQDVIDLAKKTLKIDEKGTTPLFFSGSATLDLSTRVSELRSSPHLVFMTPDDE